MATNDAAVELSTSCCYGPSSMWLAASVAPGLRAGYISKKFLCRQYLHTCSAKSSQDQCATTRIKVN